MSPIRFVMPDIRTVWAGGSESPALPCPAWSDLSRPRMCTPENSRFTHAVTNSEISRRLPRAASLSLWATSSSRVSCSLTLAGLTGFPVCRLAMRTADPSSRFVAEHASMRTGQKAIRFIGWHVRRSACGLIRHAGMRAVSHDYGKIAEHAGHSMWLSYSYRGSISIRRLRSTSGQGRGRGFRSLR